MFGVQSGVELGNEASGAMARGSGPVLCPTQSGPCSQQAHQRLYLSFYVQVGIVF